MWLKKLIKKAPKPNINIRLGGMGSIGESMSLQERQAEYSDHRENEIRRLRSTYDFDTVQGIRSIPVPCKKVNGDSATGRVEYYLRGRCFVEHRDAGRLDVAAECIVKAHELMFVSDMIWKKETFISDVHHLEKIGYLALAEKQRRLIEAHFRGAEERLDRAIIENAKSSARFLETDLVIVEDASGAFCASCAMYRKRVYSLSGKDKRFPKFPSDFHTQCSLKPWPYVHGVTEPGFHCRNIIKYSNRPFKDDRTPEEKRRYLERQEALEQEARSLAERDSRHREYMWLKKNLPDLCPKSMAGYSRMKNANTATFQKIVEEAKKLGLDLTKDQ